MQTGVEDFISLIQSNGRRVFVTEGLIDLRRLDAQNEIFILQLPDASTAAGGRGGGFGERRVVRVYHYLCGGGDLKKLGEFEDAERLEGLDLPYHATAFPITMPDGSEKLVSGVVDGELVASYKNVLG